MNRFGRLLGLFSLFALSCDASAVVVYQSPLLWRNAMQQAGYQIVSLLQTNADASLVSCITTCVQDGLGRSNSYDDLPRDPRIWMQLQTGVPIYGFGSSVQLQDSDQAGLMFASGDRLAGGPLTPLATLNNGISYEGFFGFSGGELLTDLYVGYPSGIASGDQTGSDDTFSLDSILFAVAPDSVFVPEPNASLLILLGCGVIALLKYGRRCRQGGGLRDSKT
jgi:hypothetical protein